MNFNGKNNNNASEKQLYRPTVFGSYSYMNMQSDIDVTKMNFSFWKGLMKISILNPKSNSTSEYTEWDSDNSIDGYLTPFKARILASGIDKIIAGEISNYGVKIKSGILYITKASDFGKSRDSYVLAINYVDDNGNVTSSAVYEFTNDYHFGITDYNPDAKSFNTETFNSEFELKMFRDTLINYASASDNAIAASVCDAMSVCITNKIYNKLDAIGTKVGIEKPKYGNSNSSYFSNNGGYSSNGSSNNKGESNGYDDIESMLNDLD